MENETIDTMDYDAIKITYFDALRKAKFARESFEEDFPEGLKMDNSLSVKKYWRLAEAYGAVSALERIVIPAKEAVITSELLNEIFDEYNRSTTEEEEYKALKKFYGLYEVRK